MSSENVRIGCSGHFPYSPFFDVSLAEQFRIPTSHSLKNFRVVPVPFCDSSREVIAVGGFSYPFVVGVYDVNSKQQICQCLGHRGQIRGLTSLSTETISSDPIIVSGGDTQILVFDALNGSKLGQLPNPPKFTYRLLHLPEWKNPDVFVGGCPYSVARYDIIRKRKIGEYCHHARQVFGLSGVVSQHLLISASFDHTLRVWSRDEYACQDIMNLLSRAVCCFVEQKNLIVVGLDNGSVEVWDVRSLSQRVGMTKIGGAVSDIVGIDENRVVCGCGDGTVAVLEPETLRVSAKTRLNLDVSGVCVVGRSLDDSEREAAVLERWEFGVKILLERSEFLVRVYVGDGILRVASIFLVPGLILVQ